MVRHLHGLLVLVPSLVNNPRPLEALMRLAVDGRVEDVLFDAARNALRKTFFSLKKAAPVAARALVDPADVGGDESLRWMADKLAARSG